MHYACLIKVGPNRTASCGWVWRSVYFQPVCTACVMLLDACLEGEEESKGGREWVGCHAQAFKLPFVVPYKIPSETTGAFTVSPLNSRQSFTVWCLQLSQPPNLCCCVLTFYWAVFFFPPPPLKPVCFALAWTLTMFLLCGTRRMLWYEEVHAPKSLDNSKVGIVAVPCKKKGFIQFNFL